MTFAQLIELNMVTATTTAVTTTTITLITTTMGSLKEATVVNATSIIRLISEMKEAKTARHLVTGSATFNASHANQTAVVEVQSYCNTIVVWANNEFVVTPTASPNHIEAAIWRVQATRDLLAAPLDALLANIERKNIKEGAQMTPLVVALSTPSAVAGNLQKAPMTSYDVAVGGKRSFL
jgi:hypothetical protein